MAGQSAGNEKRTQGPEFKSVTPASGHEPPKRKRSNSKGMTPPPDAGNTPPAARNEPEMSTLSTPSDVDKSADKTAGGVPLIPQAHGGAIAAGGIPGNKGGTGRPPNAFKDFLRQMRENPKVQQHLQETLEGGGNKSAYAAALKLIADYDPELPSNLTPEERKARVLELAREGARRKAAAEGGTTDA